MGSKHERPTVIDLGKARLRLMTGVGKEVSPVNSASGSNVIDLDTAGHNLAVSRHITALNANRLGFTREAKSLARESDKILAKTRQMFGLDEASF